MKNQSQNNNIQNDEDGTYIWRGDRKFYLKNEGSNWLDSEEVYKIITAYCTTLYGNNIDGAVLFHQHLDDQETNTAKQIRDNFTQSFNQNNIDLTTLILGERMQYKFYIFTNGVYFGYAFLIDDKFAHIDYTPKNLSNFIADNNKYNIENLPLQKNTINHNDSCGLGTATDICEIIDKINKKTNDLQILQWLKSKTPNQERKLTVGGEEFSTNSWNLATKDRLVELLYQNKAVALTNQDQATNIIAQQQEAEKLPINNNKSEQDIYNELIEDLKANYIQLFKEDGETIFNEIKEANTTTADTTKTEDAIERLCTFFSSVVKQKEDLQKQQKTQSNHQIIINPANKIHNYQGFEVVICDKNSITTIKRQKAKIFDNPIPDIKEDIDYAFCKQNNPIKASTTPEGDTKPASYNFGFRFDYEAGELIGIINNDKNDLTKRDNAWKKLLTEHDTVIFKLASDEQNYIRFYLNRGKDGKIEFAFDEFLFSKADALKLSGDSIKYNEIKEKSKKAIDKNERFDIHLYCKSGKEENDKDRKISIFEFDNQKPQNKITHLILDKKLQQLQIN
jgi:hypothetical protein